jgi:hypothetical protein
MQDCGQHPGSLAAAFIYLPCVMYFTIKMLGTDLAKALRVILIRAILFCRHLPPPGWMCTYPSMVRSVRMEDHPGMLEAAQQLPLAKKGSPGYSLRKAGKDFRCCGDDRASEGVAISHAHAPALGLRQGDFTT